MAKATGTAKKSTTTKVDSPIEKKVETTVNTIVEKKDSSLEDDSDFEKPLEQPAFQMPPLDITSEIGDPPKEIKFDHILPDEKKDAPIEVALMPPTIAGKIAPSSAPVEAPKQTSYIGQKLTGTSETVVLKNRVGMKSEYNRKEAERLIKQNPDCYKIVN